MSTFNIIFLATAAVFIGIPLLVMITSALIVACCWVGRKIGDTYKEWMYNETPDPNREPNTAMQGALLVMSGAFGVLDTTGRLFR